MLYQGRGEKNTYTLRLVDMCKWKRVIPRKKGSPSYWIAYGWKDEFGSWILKLLRFLMHFRDKHIYFFSFVINIFSLSFFFHHGFYLPPINSKLHYSYLLPHAEMLLVLGLRGDRDKVGTRNIFLLERYLKSSTLAPSCDLP
jgi:hypothetical protein